MHTVRRVIFPVRLNASVVNAFLLLAIAGIYILFRSHTYYWDGVSFALAIESVYRGDSPFAVLFHPNHLLYDVLGYFLYAFVRNFGFHVRAIAVLQYSNLFVSLCCGYLVFRIARRFFGTSPAAYFCWLLFSFGALWWHYSTDADAYILGTLLLMLAFTSLLQEGSWFLILAAIFHVLAMFCHELSVFFYVPAIVVIARRVCLPPPADGCCVSDTSLRL